MAGHVVRSELFVGVEYTASHAASTVSMFDLLERYSVCVHFGTLPLLPPLDPSFVPSSTTDTVRSFLAPVR